VVRKIGARARWAVPAGVVATVGIVIAAAEVASAAAAPSLPARTAAQLLAEVAEASAKPLGPFSATVQQTASLGFPALPQIVQSGQTSLVPAGSQSVSIWYGGPQRLRIAEPVQDGESDLRLDGRTLWLWSSQSQTATQIDLPARAAALHSAGPRAVLPGTVLPRTVLPRAVLPGIGLGGIGLAGNPLAAARQILAAVGPSTVVSVQRNVYVAGRAAYQLALVPKSSGSLVGKVLIAIDASAHIPLRVQVYARASGALAYSLGFTSLTFGAPAASNFTFTPPPGAIVKKESVPGNLKALGLGRLGLSPLGLLLPEARVRVFARGAGGAAIPVSPPLKAVRLPSAKALPSPVLKSITAQFEKTLPKNLSKAQRAAAIKAFQQRLATGPGSTANNGGGFFKISVPAASAAGGPKILGQSWLSVVATPPNAEVAAAVTQLMAGPHAGGGLQTRVGLGGVQQSASSVQLQSSLPSAVPVGPDLAVLLTLLRAATPVHGSWGSGRLLQTTLLSVLVTTKGQILAGAVTPGVLYADVAADAG
jgi:hypothetical protein